MPHKNPRCGVCGGRSTQLAFIKADPKRSDEFVQRGKALFECKSCKRRFVDNCGVLFARAGWKFPRGR